jgi:hypothetical protein
MKKLFAILLIAGIFSCNSDKNEKEDKSKEGANEPGIQNVNGNIPDTTNAINLDNDKRDSSSKADSTAHPNAPD